MKRHLRNGVPKVEILPTRTLLDRQIDEACTLMRELRKLERQTKMTAAGFVDMARSQATLSEPRLRELAAKLEAPTGTAACQRFVQKAAKAFATPQYPRPPRLDQTDRTLNVLGRYAEIMGELGVLDIKPSELIAVACARAAEQSKSDFGDIEHWDRREIRLANLHQAVQTLCAAMKVSWGASDVITTGTVLDSERDRGLVHVRFRRCVTLHPQVDAWPMQMIEHVLALRDRSRAERKAAKSASKVKKAKRGKKGKATEPAPEVVSTPLPDFPTPVRPALALSKSAHEFRND